MYKKYLLFIAFFCGAVVMGVELLGSRVLSPNFGNSIFVWGSLISVFMGALSMGYYLGGKYSDSSPSLNKLGLIILASALLIMLIPLIGTPVTEFIAAFQFDVRWSTLFSAMILFFLPISALGVVSPYIIKMSTTDLEKLGVSSGSVYAISTFGSIIGTLLTSFYLISVMRVSTIFYSFAGMLTFLAITMFIIDLKTKNEKGRVYPDLNRSELVTNDDKV